MTKTDSPASVASSHLTDDRNSVGHNSFSHKRFATAAKVVRNFTHYDKTNIPPELHKGTVPIVVDAKYPVHVLVSHQPQFITYCKACERRIINGMLIYKVHKIAPPGQPPEEYPNGMQCWNCAIPEMRDIKYVIPRAMKMLKKGDVFGFYSRQGDYDPTFYVFEDMEVFEQQYLHYKMMKNGGSNGSCAESEVSYTLNSIECLTSFASTNKN